MTKQRGNRTKREHFLKRYIMLVPLEDQNAVRFEGAEALTEASANILLPILGEPPVFQSLPRTRTSYPASS